MRRRVHRSGYAPDPWAWTPWQYAHDGRFAGRWDDPDGLWRTLYVGATRLACYLEVLAPFRPDPDLQQDLAQIEDDEPLPHDHPTAPVGTVPTDWLLPRRTGTATLTGSYVDLGDSHSLPTLRARFLPQARQLGVPDLDAAAIRLAEPRQLTQHIAAWLYPLHDPARQPLGGIQFRSRHGDDHTLWAIFERPRDTTTSAQISDIQTQAIQPDDPELNEAMRLHRLTWRS